ncbi:MAG: DUF2132 domain-containing protein [Verrucomicrobia bacterium]|nr:DUF2132 domain-containing protein [Verrucomicrobiota bacterium]
MSSESEKDSAKIVNNVPEVKASAPQKKREHPRDPLHGVTLESIIKYLVKRYGWAEMGRRIPVRCFLYNPDVKSSLTFLRKTPWARAKVEDWFLIDRTQDSSDR